MALGVSLVRTLLLTLFAVTFVACAGVKRVLLAEMLAQTTLEIGSGIPLSG
jgi:hypothetical protein